MAFTAKIVASDNNVPVTFDETAGSLIASSISAGSRFLVLNYTTQKLMVSIGEYSEAPSSTLTVNRNQIPVPAGTSGGNPGFTVCDEITIGNQSRCYVRSDSGSPATSGDVTITTWMHK